MIGNRALPDGLDIGLKPFIPNTRGDGNVRWNSQPVDLGPSGHVDDFARRNLPPSEQWPELVLDRPEFQYPEYLNAAVELTDRMVEKGFGDHVALIGNGRQRTYKELADWSNRLAHALVENYGVKPGNRVLIRSGNNPALVAAWLAATKAGAVVVNTMPMLRAGELTKIVDKAEIALALTDSRIADELVACAKTSRFLKQVVNFDGTSNHDAELDRVALSKPVRFDAVKTGRDDVALLGFTSGTTGEPKATMHFHRDLLIVADGYAREVLKVTPDDVFVGSPPLAFTFGLGGLAIFPLRFGATATLLENAAPAEMVKIIETYKATICFTSPTAYRAMMAAMDKGADLSSLRLAVSAGETLPAPVFDSWTRKTGKTILDGIGSTELLHIFITNRIGDAVAGTHGASGFRLRGQNRRRRHERIAAGHRRQARGSRPDRMPLSRRYQAIELCPRWLESDRRYLRPRRAGPLVLRRPLRRHDRLLRLQHRRPRGRSGVADASGGGRMRRRRRARRGARHDRQGLCGACFRRRRRCRAGDGIAGSRQARDRALQISARDRIRRAIAEDRNRQAAAIRAAADGAGRLRRPPAWPRNNACDGELFVSTSKGPTLAVLPVAKGETSAAGPQILQPSGWPMPKGYANGMAADGRLVVTGGVIGWDTEGHLPTDFVAQVRQTLENISAILGEGGARPEHLVRLTWYVVDIEEYLANLKPLGKVYREIFGAHYPAMALVQVVRLVEKAARVEIEATAVVPR